MSAPLKEMSVECFAKNYKSGSVDWRTASEQLLAMWKATDPTGYQSFMDKHTPAAAAERLIKDNIRQLIGHFEDRNGLKRH